LGQPWFLATNAVGELLYKAAFAYLKTEFIEINQVNKRFFRRFGGGGGELPGGDLKLGTSSIRYNSTTDGFKQIITSFIQYGDAQVRLRRLCWSFIWFNAVWIVFDLVLWIIALCL
jgi:hypothetical protein